MNVDPIIAQADPADSVSMAMASKALKIERQQGQEIVQMIEAVAESASPPGVGTQIDSRA